MPDFKKAREKAIEHIECKGLFETYSIAYVVTNENLRQLPQLMPKKHESVLSVVGSGDHPLWFSLYGAKHIDTFDISYNAKILMDIKVAALSCLNWCEYNRLLEDFYEINWFPCEHISSIKNMDKILPKLPETESEYIKALDNAKIFRTYCSPKKSESLPTFFEYLKLRIKVKKPYNFYLTDIKNLSNFITTSYDVIHLSNILDYVPAKEHKDIILPLLNHVNPDGRIIAHNLQYDMDEGYLNYFGASAKEIADSLDNWKYIQKTIKEPNTNIILKNGTHILERIR
ncbi:MAG: hypothetical protein IKZ49_03645 [Alphaproteobacteria bacterium]|nr:hypothetical protein [Alphaproteobacteria bacterium]